MVGRVQFVPKGLGPAVLFHSAWSVKYTWRQYGAHRCMRAWGRGAARQGGAIECRGVNARLARLEEVEAVGAAGGVDRAGQAPPPLVL